MKTKIVPIILVFVGVFFGSCKDRDSIKTSTEINKTLTEESVDPESELGKLLGKIENYILTEYLTERDLRRISKDQRKFQFHQIDLNNDGKMEILLNLPTSYFCGTGGCSVLLLTDQLNPITEFTEITTPIYVQEEIENGWKVLMVQSGGRWRKLIYEDDSYPSNPLEVEVSRDSPTKSADVLFDNDKEVVRTYPF